MRKLKVFGIALTAVALMYSCSSSTESKLQEKWWYKVSNYGDDIIFFSENGKNINLNEDKSNSYEIEGDEIKIKRKIISGVDLQGDDFEINQKDTVYTLKITKISDAEMVLSVNGRDTEYRVAEHKDFLIGKWKGSYQGKKFKVKFEKDGEFEGKVKREKTEGYYSCTGNKLKMDNKEYTYSLSENYNNLTLQGEETIELIRDL